MQLIINIRSEERFRIYLHLDSRKIIIFYRYRGILLVELQSYRKVSHRRNVNFLQLALHVKIKTYSLR